MTFKEFNQIFISFNKLFFFSVFIYDQKAVSVTKTHYEMIHKSNFRAYSTLFLFFKNPGFQNTVLFSSKTRVFKNSVLFIKTRVFKNSVLFIKTRVFKNSVLFIKTRVLCLKVFFKFVLHLFSTRCLWKTTENIFRGG